MHRAHRLLVLGVYGGACEWIVHTYAFYLCNTFTSEVEIETQEVLTPIISTYYYNVLGLIAAHVQGWPLMLPVVLSVLLMAPHGSSARTTIRTFCGHAWLR
ncbi:hypothetical protein DFJ58DRAFT_424429 [Suillus subalutaceus]|uniref:uncharacterized protein n=1 Tax=Suillus subalutaceus TaxID=48586 RepID=UPI001B86BF30|nr:uncharacterized protein DFJ58DRAFT_424429 [Suillus subalutaceus]KAG1851472.1 hypothetical protein DFJ58DRAFT_424429 [Suillus subalutaceus]